VLAGERQEHVVEIGGLDREIDDVDARVIEFAQDAAQGRDAGLVRICKLTASSRTGSWIAAAAASCVAGSAKLRSMRPPICCLSS
jgi:hypothetical protein